jgi:hypothetical protein
VKSITTSQFTPNYYSKAKKYQNKFIDQHRIRVRERGGGEVSKIIATITIKKPPKKILFNATISK